MRDVRVREVAHGRGAHRRLRRDGGARSRGPRHRSDRRRQPIRRTSTRTPSTSLLARLDPLVDADPFAGARWPLQDPRLVEVVPVRAPPPRVRRRLPPPLSRPARPAVRALAILAAIVIGTATAVADAAHRVTSPARSPRCTRSAPRRARPRSRDLPGDARPDCRTTPAPRPSSCSIDVTHACAGAADQAACRGRRRGRDQPARGDDTGGSDGAGLARHGLPGGRSTASCQRFAALALRSWR